MSKRVLPLQECCEPTNDGPKKSTADKAPEEGATEGAGKRFRRDSVFPSVETPVMQSIPVEDAPIRGATKQRFRRDSVFPSDEAPVMQSIPVEDAPMGGAPKQRFRRDSVFPSDEAPVMQSIPVEDAPVGGAAKQRVREDSAFPSDEALVMQSIPVKDAPMGGVPKQRFRRDSVFPSDEAPVMQSIPVKDAPMGGVPKQRFRRDSVFPLDESPVMQSIPVEDAPVGGAAKQRVREDSVFPSDETLVMQRIPVENAPVGGAPKQRLRQDSVFPSTDTTYSNVPYLPYVQYTGKIEYYTNLTEIACRSNELMRQITRQLQETENDIPLAFDMEWPLTYKSGSDRTALIQLCLQTDCCILFQVSTLRRLPVALTHLLYHPRVVLHGVNIKNDFRKLQRDYPEFKAEMVLQRCVDLGEWYNRLYNVTGLWSLAQLTELCLGLRLNKSTEVRISRWDISPLSEEQKLYAAIDVYVVQKLYHSFAEKQRQRENLLKCHAAAWSNIECQKAEDITKAPLSTSNHDPKPSPS